MLSIIVPVYNEDESLLELQRQIVEACTKHNIDYEVILIDDGSRDDSWKMIQQLKANNSAFQGIRFRRNFGKAAALTVGMKAAQGDTIMMMDADLQDDPEEIPAFQAKISEGYDVVNGWKKRRLDPWHKVYPSRVFNQMIGSLTGLHLHDHNCGLKMFRKQVANEIQIYGELHRFIPVLAHARGFKVTELVVNHRPRQFGHSKYGIKRFVRGFLDLLTVSFLISYGTRPQHLLGGVGLTAFGLGILGLAYLCLLWISMNIFGVFTPSPIGQRPLLMYSLGCMLLGFQAFATGLLAELIISKVGEHDSVYSISETTNS
jgi:glycosyltransferase involved in cell wall biosynthesis